MRRDDKAYRGRAFVPKGGGAMPDKRKAADKAKARGRVNRDDEE